MSESNLIGRLRRYADTQRRGLYREEPDAMDEAADKLVQLSRSLAEAREALRECVESIHELRDNPFMSLSQHKDRLLEIECEARRNLLDANAREGGL